jgi:hypothetical protein
VDVILAEIKRALDARAYYAALMTTLTLPDVCAALASPGGKTTKSKKLYKAWCDRWFTGYPDLTSTDLYSLRCGVVHQGTLGHGDSQFARVIFSLPESPVVTVLMDDMLSLDLHTFCQVMMDAVERWYATEKHNRTVQENLPRLVQVHPDGLPPYIVGIPFIG